MRKLICPQFRPLCLSTSQYLNLLGTLRFLNPKAGLVQNLGKIFNDVQLNEIEATPRRHALSPYVTALFCTAFQLGVALWQCEPGNLAERYRSFCKWDCGWYAEIARDGYKSHFPLVAQDHSSNVAFFPAFPVVSGLVSRLTGTSTYTTNVLVATFCTFFAWYFFYRLLKRIGLSEFGIAVTSFILISHPGSFFLIMGYSESMFVPSLLAVLEFSLANDNVRSACAAALATLCRIVGLPISLFPVLMRIFGDRNSRAVRYSLLVPATACSALLLFFGYCQLRFGVWNLYFVTQKVGWNLAPDYLFPLRALKDLNDARSWDRALWISTWLLIGGAVILELVCACIHQFSQQRKMRVSLYICAFLVCYLISAAGSGRQLLSFVRHSLPVCALVLLGLASFWVVAREKFPRSMLAAGAIATLLAIPSWAYMLFLTSKFLHGDWVG